VAPVQANAHNSAPWIRTALIVQIIESFVVPCFLEVPEYVLLQQANALAHAKIIKIVQNVLDGLNAKDLVPSVNAFPAQINAPIPAKATAIVLSVQMVELPVKKALWVLVFVLLEEVSAHQLVKVMRIAKTVRLTPLAKSDRLVSVFAVPITPAHALTHAEVMRSVQNVQTAELLVIKQCLVSPVSVSSVVQTNVPHHAEIIRIV